MGTPNKPSLGRRAALTLVGCALVLLAAGCGSSATTIGGEGDTAPPTDGAGLVVRLSGSIDGDLLCPGSRRPCLPFEGELTPGSGGVVLASGRILDGVFVVDSQEPLPSFPDRDYTNRCPDDDLPSPASDAVMMALEPMVAGDAEGPPGLVEWWDSDDGVLHIGVAGDVGPASAFLDELGLGDDVCVAGGFPYSMATLEATQAAAGDLLQDLGYESFASSRDGWEGTISVTVPRADVELRAALDQVSAANGGVPIEISASVEVLGGTIADYEAALARAGVAPDPGTQLTASCGAAVFSSVPPDLDEFPPLDDEARLALDELLEGPTGIEAGGFDSGIAWSIAARSETEMVLFGQGEDAEGPLYRDVRFQRRDGAWTPSGWGGCWIRVGAVGLGPAQVAIDPDQPPAPDTAELALLINELACASGQAPIDREVVPVVEETDESVTVTVLVAPVEGDANCQGNPWHPITVTLDAPLGARQLLSGNEFPPLPMGAPEGDG